MTSIRSFRIAFVAAFTLAAVVAAVAQRGPVPDPVVREGVTTKVAGHTWVIPDDNVPLVPNVGIVVGSAATLVIDPGLGRANGEAVLREVAKVSRNEQLFIGTTHFHPEHTTGYLAFPASARYVNSTAQEAEWVESGTQMVQAFSKRSPATAALLADAVRRPADITFERDHIIDLGGVTVHVLLVGPTHTRGDTVFFVEQDRVLFAGDVVMNQSFRGAGAAASMRGWLAAFDAFDAWKPTVVVPAHGAVGTGALIGENRAFMSEIQSRAQALAAEGRSADEAAKIVTAELTAKHPGWPRANGIANATRAAFAEVR